MQSSNGIEVEQNVFGESSSRMTPKRNNKSLSRKSVTLRSTQQRPQMRVSSPGDICLYDLVSDDYIAIQTLS